MKNNFYEQQKKEALERIGVLTWKYNLNPKIKKYFEDDKLYYSYLTAGGLMASIDEINYDDRYPEVVKNFEKQGGLVYHCIESENTLTLLFVGNNEDDWPAERLWEDYIPAYVYNFSNPELSEIGDIIVSAFGNSGALIRIG